MASNSDFGPPIDPSLYADGCWTIDASPTSAGPNPNRYLEYARACKNQSYLPNNSAIQAIQALESCAGSKNGVHLNIVGHGKAGVINAGSGEDGGVAADAISIATLKKFANLESELGRLSGQIASLRLWSCNTGAGDWGLHLLSALSKALNCDCYAPVGQIACMSPCGFALQKGTDWQWVGPNHQDPLAASPDPIVVPFIPSGWTWQIEPRVWITLKQVSRIQVERSGSAPIPFTDGEAIALVQKIDVASPRSFTGGLGATVTARFNVSYMDNEHKERIKSFAVYNDTIVRGVGDLSYYWCDDSFIPTAFGTN